MVLGQSRPVLNNNISPKIFATKSLSYKDYHDNKLERLSLVNIFTQLLYLWSMPKETVFKTHFFLPN